ncbi:MAG: SAM-dependent DNA methyltransferase [Betaproteobacteria bacterium]|nr:SAM-dependent DNA methyltransferase [Betaproteobacteria bacterium]
MDASQYKDYVLVLLFFKYVSDKYAGDPSALIDVPAGGTLMQLRFASFAVINLRRDLHPQECAHKKKATRVGRPVGLSASGHLAGLLEPEMLANR